MAQAQAQASRTNLKVHRCRFVDFSPAPITALAFPPLPLPSAKGKKRAGLPPPGRVGALVVGRANGNIELCEWSGAPDAQDAPQAWTVRKTLAGPAPSKVDSLALALRYPWKLKEEDVPAHDDLRIFTAGGGSALLEWDPARGAVRRTISSNAGAIWSLAVNPASTLLAMGCEDGAVQILTLEDDALAHLRRLDRSKSRILSLAWGPAVPPPPKPAQKSQGSDSDSDSDDEAGWGDAWLVAGCSDSSLRRYDFASGRMLARMGTDKVRGERTLVWAVAVLGDGTIVSGDSLGTVKFWDPATGTQRESFAAHGADVLCLAPGPDGASVYSSGIDQRTIQFARVQTAPGASALSAPARWIQAAAKRAHSHDVRALALWPPHAPLPRSHARAAPPDLVPIVVSGGLDASAAAAPAAPARSTAKARLANPLATSVAVTFEDSYARRLAYGTGAHGAPGVHIARGARLVLCVREAGVSLWRIPPLAPAAPAEGEGDAPERAYEEVLEMELSVRTNLVAGAISDDGAWLAVSDCFEVKLFALTTTPAGDVVPRRVRDFHATLAADGGSDDGGGAAALLFTPDSSRLVLADHAARVLVIELAPTPRVIRRFAQHRLADGADGDDEDAPQREAAVPATVARLAVSPDGQWLASADDARRTHVFSLDALRHHATLPRARAGVRALAFTASGTLVLGHADNSLLAWDAEARRAPPRALGAGGALGLGRVHDPLVGLSVDESAGDACVVAWSANWLARVPLGREGGGARGPKKRRRERAKAAAAAADQGVGEPVRLVTHYRQLLALDFVGPAEMALVERPLVDVLARLPPAYFKPKYGAS